MSVEASNPVTRIRPTGGWRAIDLGELWRYRELLYFLAWRDIKLRYKQTALGVAWAVLQPLATMLVFSLFFGKLGNMKYDGPNYPIFVMAALLPWQLFAYSLTQASNSLVSEQRLITKVYFPRLIVPFSSVLAGLADFFVTFVLLLGMMAYYGQAPTWAILALPAFVAFAVLAALSVGLWLSALTVRYRDFRYTLPFLTQFWLFATPVAYSSSIIPPAYRPLYGLNPMAGVVDGFRWCLLGTEPPGGMMIVSVLVVAVLFVGGLFYFRRLEKTFADIV